MNNDWIGWQRAKRFFSNQDFVWFDPTELRDEKNLDAEQIKYLRGWTASPLGIANFFYLGYRKLYDLLIFTVALYVISEVMDSYSDSILDFLSPYVVLGLLYLITSFILFLIGVYMIYFTFRHARRLSWNRGAWSSVEELKASERRWFYFNTLPSLALVVLVLSFLMKAL